MITLQNGIDVLGIAEGPAILLIGILALLLWAVVTFQNPSGIALWAFTVVLVSLAVLFPVPIEVVWVGIALTSVLTIVGVTANVIQ